MEVSQEEIERIAIRFALEMCQATRRKTIEDCAKVAELHVGEHGDDHTSTAETIADEIRALADQEPVIPN